MTFDLAKILQEKREFRQRAASLPIEEKLAMLDALRESTLTLRSSQNDQTLDITGGQAEPPQTQQGEIVL